MNRIFPDDCPDGEDSALVAELRRMLAEVVVERDTMQTDAHDELSALRAQLADRTREVEALLACATYHDTPAGPLYRGWNVSALSKLRVEIRAARAAPGAKP